MDAKDWAERIVNDLFERDNSRLMRMQEELIDANHKAGGHPHGFLFGGKFMNNLPFADQAKAEKKLMEPALHEAGRAYIEDVERIEREYIRVRLGIFVVLQGCRTKQDVRDALPEVVVSIIPELALMQRTREPGFMFADRPLHMHSFKETEELLNFYVCNQLLY